MNTIIKTENVTKVLNRGRPNEVRPVRDVSMEISKGETVVLKGPSGSGKTSLLSLVGCMNRPTSGKIIVKGKDVAKLPERFLNLIRRNTFGFIFQQLNLINGISVKENIMLPLYPTGSGFPELKKRAENIMDKLGITHRKHFPVQGLSGGEQQRVAIARALINNPDIILADEPTAHLDTKLSGDLINIMKLLKEEGKTIVIATHDPLIYERDFIDRMIEMRDGKII
ncbi:macrolide export ATP-binding/permease protein MacB [bacterium BMS3Abin07]|nr:macrolide export ATP-binding/permease protein MacB [bacterium BMS3Abin07]GBE31269.1 macrolide export ATP-binding/permease protein MacB [bacterium BMS3Bbin05]HDL21279.1 ABC transporter ATP-binding protein [Nitrospirota bacterium]HDO22485.1 ABC transporter ATP-binding protein [Nitrospirota bacterium]HDZ88485.1 ABC transporter ATP-binding protein [Nitrospirota bacterium]